MKRYIKYIMIIFAAVFSCDDNPFLVDCRDCVSEEPAYTSLLIKLDPDINEGLSPSAIVKIYEGRLEDNNLIGTYYVPGRSFEPDVTLNRKYTVTASYTDNKGKTYIAVDSAFPRLKYEKSQCEDPCWYVYDRVVNLVIKYRR